MGKVTTSREKLIDTIIDLAGDEYVTREDAFRLAKSSTDELIDILINNANYYRDEYNS